MTTTTDLTLRCFGDPHEDYQAYHDYEWGVPIRGEVEIYERLVLEAFQSGLSWLTILRKRAAFREAFSQFDPRIVADFSDADRERLMTDAGIVRNRLKIDAALNNARAVVTLQDAGQSLSDLVWSFAPERHDVPRSWSDVPASTPESVALAKALKKAGFVFVGPATMYALMQACGLVNDHLENCLTRKRM